MYKCEICGKEYATLKERVACETACISRLEKEEAETKAKKLAEEKQKRIDEIEKVEKHLAELRKKFLDDYGYLNITRNNENFSSWLDKMLSWME